MNSTFFFCKKHLTIINSDSIIKNKNNIKSDNKGGVEWMLSHLQM